MDADIWITLLSTVLGALLTAVPLTLIASITQRLRRRRRERELSAKVEQPTLEQKLELVATMSGQLSRLNGEIQEEFTAQVAETERLRTEAEAAKETAALNEKAKTAVANLVASEMKGALKENSKSERKFQWIFLCIGFLAGIVASLVASWIFALISAAVAQAAETAG